MNEIRFKLNQQAIDPIPLGEGRDLLGEIETLGKMARHNLLMSDLIEAAKRKGVRFDISEFSDDEVKGLDDNVIAFRGRALDYFNRVFYGVEK